MGTPDLEAVPTLVTEPTRGLFPSGARANAGRLTERPLVLAGVIVVLGAAVRFASLTGSVWFDESVSVGDVTGGLGAVVHKVINHEASPPGYFVLLWIWRHLVGETAADLRSLSAVAGTLTVGLAFYAGRRHLGDRGGLILALCVAVSPALIYYSTEMRMYGVLILITGVGFEAFLQAHASPRHRALSVWAVASVLAIWTQYYSVLIVAPEAMLLLAAAWRQRPHSLPTLAAVGGVVLGGLPLVYLMPYQARHAWAYGERLVSSPWQHIGLSIHYPSTLFGIAQDLLAGPGAAARAPITVLAAVIGGVACAVAVRRRWAEPGQIVRGVVLIAPAVVVVAVLIELHVLLEGRYLLPFWLPVGLTAAYGLASIPVGPLGAGLVAGLVCAWIAVGAVSHTDPRYALQDDALGAARSLGTASTPRLVAINQPWDTVPVEDYRPRLAPDSDPVVRTRELDVIAMPAFGEPFPGEHQRPASIGAGSLPTGFRLASVIRGSTFLVERFVARAPVAVRVDGHGRAFTSSNWRFFREPAGAGMGTL